MLKGNGWVLTEEGIAAVEAFVEKSGHTLNWFWEYKLQRDQSNWYNAIGHKGKSTSARTIRDILAAAKLPEDPKYFLRREPAPVKLKVHSPVTAPVVTGKVSRSLPPPNPFFTGRDDILERLHQALAIGDAALTPFPQALTGMGGIGKTQTAIAYAHQHRHDYRGIYWVSAEAAEALHAGLVALAPELDPPVPVQSEQAATLKAVKDWFATHSDWLLILDNADDLKHLAEDFPPHHNGRLLLTTRAQATGKLAKPIRIAKLSPEDGALLLLRRARILDELQFLEAASEEDRQAALAISTEVDGLPLALGQAGAYLEESFCTPREYLCFYRERGLELLDQYADRDHKSVTITFSLALQQLEKLPEIGQAAANFVRLCAFLAPDAIPEEVFTSGQFELDGLPSPLTEPDYIRVRAAVLAYSVLSRDAEPRTLSIHRLVQDVIKQTMTAEDKREWLEHAVNSVSAVSPDGIFEFWPRCKRLLAQWRVCEKYIADDTLETAEAAYLLRQMGTYFSERLEYNEAETLLLRSQNLYEKKHSHLEAEFAVLCNNIAIMYVRRGRYAEGRTMMLRAITLFGKASDAKQAEMAMVMHNLASLYLAQHRYAKAAPLFRRVGIIRTKELGAENLATASTYASLAYVYYFQKKYAESETLFREALQIYAAQPEGAPLERAGVLSNLAMLYCELDAYTEAVQSLEQALHIRGKYHGDSDPEIARYRLKLALVQVKQGQTDLAEAGFRQELEVLIRVLGRRHPDTLRFLQDYAEFLEDTGRAAGSGTTAGRVNQSAKEAGFARVIRE